MVNIPDFVGSIGRARQHRRDRERDLAERAVLAAERDAAARERIAAALEKAAEQPDVSDVRKAGE